MILNNLFLGGVLMSPLVYIDKSLSEYDNELKYTDELKGYTLRYVVMSPNPEDEPDKKPSITITGISFTKKFTKDKVVEIPKMIDGLPVKAIGNRAFCDNKRMRKVVLPNSIDIIGISAFKNSFIESISLGSGLTYIDRYAFFGCCKLTSIAFPEKLECISDSAFERCCKLTHITFPENLITVAFAAFNRCDALESVYIGSNLSELGAYADDGFGVGCPLLKEITISPLNKHLKIDKDIIYDVDRKALIRVFNNNKTKNITIPEWVECVGFDAFESVNINKLIIKSPSVENIDNSGIENPRVVYCIPDSDVGNYFNEEGIPFMPITENQIGNFLNNLDNKNIDR